MRFIALVANYSLFLHVRRKHDAKLVGKLPIWYEHHASKPQILFSQSILERPYHHGWRKIHNCLLHDNKILHLKTNIKEANVTLREKCLYLQFFWPVFPRIWTKFEELLRISLYSVRMRGNTD